MVTVSPSKPLSTIQSKEFLSPVSETQICAPVTSGFPEYPVFQVLINNLLSNAVKFSPENGVITVTIQRIVTDKGAFQEFSIGDEGDGIKPEKQKNLFNPYAQLEDKEGKLPKGTGLGLAVAKLTIDAHGGEIGYRDGNPRGSVFYFRLPENNV